MMRLSTPTPTRNRRGFRNAAVQPGEASYHEQPGHVHPAVRNRARCGFAGEEHCSAFFKALMRQRRTSAIGIELRLTARSARRECHDVRRSAVIDSAPRLSSAAIAVAPSPG